MARDDLSTLLRAAAPTTNDDTDVDALWARGRRLRARRRAGQVTATVAVIAVLGGGLVTLAGGQDTAMRFGGPPLPEGVEVAEGVASEPAPRVGGVDFQRVAAGADEREWAVLVQRSEFVEGVHVRVEGVEEGTAAVLPAPEEALAATVQEIGDARWVVAALDAPAERARVHLADGSAFPVDTVDSGLGLELAVVRLPYDSEDAEADTSVEAVEALDEDGGAVTRVAGDELAHPAVGSPSPSALEEFASGEHDGDDWTLEVDVDGQHLPAEWTAVQLQVTVDWARATTTVSWQVGGHPAAPFRPGLVDADDAPLLVSGWAPDDAHVVRIHHADGSVTETAVHRPSGSPFAFYASPAPADDDHATAGVVRVEAVDVGGDVVEHWEH
ncbi:hypothetical protein ER308_03885 [Egibacter rhizosphaerae]|uniref:Uncharacterized protein n=1 Tax=Egibacter rhizosphaerae TaxID=1670831 RepID=A0A411YC42_9ACTN|nr:hypothetical protein [Egibacter rhizosphaerae]QBI18774.1 hypothetical protein ER308_03885 [Egibacter rhizosphaerae]